MLSDESTSDSDSGIRFKTDSTRRQDSNADSPLERNKGGRDNRRYDGPADRNRRGFFSGNRDRERRDRRSPPKGRERSPFQNRGRFNADRHPRDDRARVEHRQRAPSPSRERPRDNHGERTSSRDDKHERNGAKRESQQRSGHSRENSEDKRKREAHRLREKKASVEKHIPKETDPKRDNDRKRSLEKKDSRTRDVKDRLTLKTERHLTEKSGRISSPPNRQINRNAIEGIRKILKDDVNSRERDSSSANRSRAISPIRFDKSPFNSDRQRSVKSISKEKEKKRKVDKSPVNILPPLLESSQKAVKKTGSPPLADAEDLSDTEPKPVSYYNMISAIPLQIDDENIKVTEDEPIAVSDSSEDEVALRRKLLLLEDELKKTKKKTKHKEKKAKKHRKKTKASKSGSDLVSNSEKSDGQADTLIEESRTMKVTISSVTDVTERRVVTKIVPEVINDSPSPVKKIKSEESNEEGEIVSDSDDQKLTMETSDLRHRLGRQIGPMLPSIAQNKLKVPDLREKLSVKTESKETSVPGPTLPPHLRAKEEFDDGNSPVVEGPALPPHLKKNLSDKTNKYLGPSVTAEMRESLAKRAPSPAASESDDGEVVGPVPMETDKAMSDAQLKLEERALRLKMNSLEGGAVKQEGGREEWMLELPDAKAKHIGLGPRQFRAKAAPDMSDRSMWTDTPEQKALKAAGITVNDDEKAKVDLEREAEMQFIAERDREQEEAAKKHKKKHKRDKSLLEIHEKKLEKKKKKDKESGESTRRPFDRDIDLKANRFDEAQKKSIMKKAQLLDTRFSTGESKFL